MLPALFDFGDHEAIHCPGFMFPLKDDMPVDRYTFGIEQVNKRDPFIRYSDDRSELIHRDDSGSDERRIIQRADVLFIMLIEDHPGFDGVAFVETVFDFETGHIGVQVSSNPNFFSVFFPGMMFVIKTEFRGIKVGGIVSE